MRFIAHSGERFFNASIRHHGGTNENSRIRIVRRWPPWHGVHGAGSSRRTGPERTSGNHRDRLALWSGLARQSLGALRSEPAILSSLPLLGTATLPPAPPSSSLAASPPSPSPRTPPSSPWASSVIRQFKARLDHRGGFLLAQSGSRGREDRRTAAVLLRCARETRRQRRAGAREHLEASENEEGEFVGLSRRRHRRNDVS